VNSSRAWLIWGIGVFAYLVAVTQRTSFGVAGLQATERFGATASALSAFTVLQLLVYAVLQIPVGVLVDRFGARLMIALGAALMCLGQLQLAAASSVPAGLVGRVLVGAGDAMTFVSVLRLLPAWFDARRIPLLTQLTGQLGQLGQLISVVPFVAVLHAYGWSTAFVASAALSLVAFAAAASAIRNQPPSAAPAQVRQGFREIGTTVSRAWTQPGTRLGLWSHWTLQFTGNVFILTWGYPFLISGQGISQSAASGLMSLFVLVGIISGPMLGGWVSRHPLRRSTLVLLTAAGIVLLLAITLLYPGRAPLWLLVLLVISMALGGPASMIGIDFARTFNPAHRMGTATGIVNMGGFCASLVAMYVIGVVLDLLNTTGFSHGNLYSLDSFRIAFCVLFLVMAVGVIGVVVCRREVRRRMAADGQPVPPLREALADRSRRKAQYRRERRERSS
jgi:sugar phosphate permease